MRNWLVGCFTLTLALAAAASDEFQPSPPTKVSELPRRAWNGKNEPKMEGPFAEAAVLLFKAGLPDPAGLPYHTISIPTGNCYYGDGGLIETRGWMLPADDGARRFAIAWNGLVYPVAKDSGKADFKADAEAILDNKEEEFGSFGWSMGEANDVSPGAANLLHGIFLTRLGRADAAKALLTRRENPPKDMPRMLANEWAWSHYDRAVCAHMRGDPRLVLASLRDLERIKPALEPILASDDKKARPPFSWADQFDPLEQECRRRIDAGKIGPFNQEKFAAADHDPAELIDALDRIHVAQDGQPGDVWFTESPIVKALVKKGSDAVEPLLQCLAHDRRLTQSTHFWRSHHKQRTVLGVHEAALYALEWTLHASYFQLASTGDSLTGRGDKERARLAEIIRADWESHGKTTGAERAYLILVDDEAGRDRWLDAALSLLHPDRYDDETGEPIPPEGPLPGEPLRDRKDPSVSDLLERRIDDVIRTPGDSKYDQQDSSYARIDFLKTLAEWDPPRARERIGKHVKGWLADSAWKREPLRGFCVLIEEAAPKAPELWPLFREIVWNTEPSQHGHGTSCAFITRVMVDNASSEEMQEATAGLWSDPKSPWCLSKLSESDLSSLTRLWHDQKLLDREPFRSTLRQALDDESSCAELFLDPEDPQRWCLDHGGVASWPVPESKRFALKPGDRWPVRRMDVVARVLDGSDWEDDSLFKYWWSEKERDARIAKWRKSLGR